MPAFSHDTPEKAAELGVPSLVWRAGQERRWRMIEKAAGERLNGSVFEDGSGVGVYLQRMAVTAKQAVGLEVEFARAHDSHKLIDQMVCGTGEGLPFRSDAFDLILSHEVLEHVQDDQKYITEIIRTLKPGGRLVLFCPNRGYPFETHGIYWRNKYYFGNKPLINYLPRSLRDKLAPHVNVYTRRDLKKLFAGLPVQVVERKTIFGAYDNIIARLPHFGKYLRAALQALEKTPLQVLGLSHFWIVEKLTQ
ncbi:MAG: methyltransferase domain-containing protein [Chloroflexi bacterium]|nr:methyltransferase domain-containing protein [Chloroflexota bacterium]